MNETGMGVEVLSERPPQEIFESVHWGSGGSKLKKKPLAVPSSLMCWSLGEGGVGVELGSTS
jgi:hypothetical protein